MRMWIFRTAAVVISRRALLVLAAVASIQASAGVTAADVNVGDKAPVFTALDQDGKSWKSEDHVGSSIIVVYFYPADMTGGCTKQACAFRDDLSGLKQKGVEVVGVSGDSVRNHQLFRKAHSLNFTLLADTEGRVAEAFGVPVTKEEKSVKAVIDGKDELLTRSITAKRWTFVIGRDGKVAAKNTMVVAAEDSRAIADIVAKLAKQQ